MERRLSRADGKRLSFDRVRDALDVGCGVGHWGRLLANVLPSGARVFGVDRDPLWVEKAALRAFALGLGDRFDYRLGIAEKLPFTEASFDLVTCQTLLIHLPDPGAAIDEMIRVARPGGLVLAAEPNNLASALAFDSLNFHDPVDEIIARARLQLICERGKAALGEGANSIGELVPGLFAARGLLDVRVWSNDKANAFLPPYEAPSTTRRCKSAPSARVASSGFGAARTHGAISSRAEVTTRNSPRCGRSPSPKTPNSPKPSRTGHTPAAGGTLGYLVAGRKPG